MNNRQDVEYNEFLFAPIGEEASGLKLSVLSALARQNIDPWQEAATLARLSTSAARSRLAGAITAALGHTSDADNLAAHLIVLLPQSTPVAASVIDFTFRHSAQGNRLGGYLSSTSGRELIVMILFMAGLTIGMNYLLPHHNPNAHPTVQSATTSQPRTPGSPK